MSRRSSWSRCERAVSGTVIGFAAAAAVVAPPANAAIPTNACSTATGGYSFCTRTDSRLCRSVATGDRYCRVLLSEVPAYQGLVRFDPGIQVWARGADGAWLPSPVRESTFAWAMPMGEGWYWAYTLDGGWVAVEGQRVGLADLRIAPTGRVDELMLASVDRAEISSFYAASS